MSTMCILCCNIYWHIRSSVFLSCFLIPQIQMENLPGLTRSTAPPSSPPRSVFLTVLTRPCPRRRLSILHGNTYTWWILDIRHYLSMTFENKFHSAFFIIIFQGLWWHGSLWSRGSTSFKSGKWSTSPAMVHVQVPWSWWIWKDGPVDEETFIS